MAAKKWGASGTNITPNLNHEGFSGPTCHFSAGGLCSIILLHSRRQNISNATRSTNCGNLSHSSMRFPVPICPQETLALRLNWEHPWITVPTRVVKWFSHIIWGFIGSKESHRGIRLNSIKLNPSAKNHIAFHSHQECLGWEPSWILHGLSGSL